MYIDNSLLLAENQALTASGASTSYIDTTVGAGEKYILYNDANKMPWFFVLITTAVTGGTSVAFELQTCGVSTFLNGTTLFTTGAIAVANLTAGKYACRVRIPKGVTRYLRGYATIVGTLSTGKWTMGIAEDIDMNIQEV